MKLYIVDSQQLEHSREIEKSLSCWEIEANNSRCSLRILVAGDQKGVTLQQNILNESPRLS